MSLTSSNRSAETSAPILDVLSERWSPRAFDPAAEVTDAQLTASLEAARWAPSASNSQPWRFIVVRRGTPEFELVRAALMGFNSAWAGSAAVLVVAVAITADEDGKELRWATYDVGQAMAHFSVQAHAEGLHVHQMGGFRADAIRTSFDLPERMLPLTISAVGAVGSPDLLAEPARERELAPRSRRPLAESLLAG